MSRHSLRGAGALALVWIAPAAGVAADPVSGGVTEMATQAAIWVALGALLPLLAVTATAYAKAAVVLAALRAGLGASGVLPLAVTTGLAALLAALVMAPVAKDVLAATSVDAQVEGPAPADPGPPDAAPPDAAPPDAAPPQADWAAPLARGWAPLEAFLVAHTRPEDAEVVAAAGARLGEVSPDAPQVRIAAFLLSELTAAFSLAVLLLLPFLVIDLLVAHTLAVIGFSLLSPGAVALPLKLLLFVAADGWTLLVRGFAASYGS